MTNFPGPEATPRSLFVEKLSMITDPRRTNKGNIRYPMTEILFLTISAAVSGMNSWVGVQMFGEEKLSWLRKFFPFEAGIPSHDALGDFFAALDPAAFEHFFVSWVNSIAEISDSEIVALDGKTIRGSGDKGKKYPLHMVSAYATSDRICLGQKATDEKSNEIKAIPELLDMLTSKGCTVTIDAIGCQKKLLKKSLRKRLITSCKSRAIKKSFMNRSSKFLIVVQKVFPSLHTTSDTDVRKNESALSPMT
jgi:predicted transposase YbfD/YdcC